MKIEPGYWRCRNGSRARVLCTDAPGDYPVVGYIIESDEECPANPFCWTVNGLHFASCSDSDSDLIEPWREPRRLKFWTNLYPDGRFEGIHMTKKEARAWAEEGAVPVYVTGVEGAGPDQLGVGPEGEG